MTIIHAFPRRKPHTVELNGQKLEFKDNGKGHFVCDVTDEKAAKRLLEIKDHYKVYGAEAAPDPDEELDASPFVITNGDETVDLRTLSDEQLHAFAKDNDIKVHPNAKGDTVRTKIVEALNSVG
jgi:hypothetical protein